MWPGRDWKSHFLTQRHLCMPVSAHVCARGRRGWSVWGGAVPGQVGLQVTSKSLSAWGSPGGRLSRGRGAGPAAGRVLTLGLARGGGLLGTSMLDEHVVLVAGAPLLAHLHHLHLGQCRVPLHHVLGAQGHQAADLQLAPAGTERTRLGEPAAPRPRASPEGPSPGHQLSRAPRSPSTRPQAKTKPGRTGSHGCGRSTRAPVPAPELHAPDGPGLLPVVGRPEGKDEKEGKVVTVLSGFYRG